MTNWPSTRHAERRRSRTMFAKRRHTTHGSFPIVLLSQLYRICCCLFFNSRVHILCSNLSHLDVHYVYYSVSPPSSRYSIQTPAIQSINTVDQTSIKINNPSLPSRNTVDQISQHHSTYRILVDSISRHPSITLTCVLLDTVICVCSFTSHHVSPFLITPIPSLSSPSLLPSCRQMYRNRQSIDLAMEQTSLLFCIVSC